MVEAPVIKAFTHEGRAFSVGSSITVEPVVAAALHRRGVVSLTRGYQAVVVQAETPKRRRRTYRRRDLQAETK